MNKDDCCMISSDRIWQLIARALNEEASSTELQELAVYLGENPSLLQQYELLTRVWHEHDNSQEDEEHARESIYRIISKAEKQDDALEVFERTIRRRKRRNYFAVAASVVLLLVAGGFFFNKSRTASASGVSDQEAIIAKHGSRTRSLLSDGTVVWLNAGSRLTYDNDFSGATREVKLEGEAFFDVVKNPEKPFIVHAGGIDIKVLGTSFNVKSYPEDKSVETTLYHGLVKVFRQQESEQNAISLIPNQKLIIAKDAATEEVNLSENLNERKAMDVLPSRFTIALIDSTKKESERFETAWLYSRLEFRGDNFDELALKLERWYNVSIRFTDEKVKTLNFNGSFEKETVEQALMYLRETIPFDYKVNNQEIIIGSAK